MKKTLYVFILLVLTSCAGIKKTTALTDNSHIDSVAKTSAVVSVKNDSIITDKSTVTTSDKTNTAKYTSKSDSVKTNYKVIFFDTSKPVTISGTPPVSSIFESNSKTYSSSETSELEKKELRKEIENDIRKEYENIYSSKFDSMISLISEQNTKLSEKTSTKKNNIYPFLIGLSLPIFLYLVFFIRKKLKILAFW